MNVPASPVARTDTATGPYGTPETSTSTVTHPVSSAGQAVALPATPATSVRTPPAANTRITRGAAQGPESLLGHGTAANGGDQSRAAGRGPSGSGISSNGDISSNSDTPSGSDIPVDVRILEQFAYLQSQLSELREQHRRIQQVATLGTTTMTLIHELNNMILPVREWAKTALDNDDDAMMRRALQVAIRQTDAIEELGKRIAGLAEPHEHRIQPVNLHELVEYARDCLVRSPAKDGIALRIDVPEDLHVAADDKELTQVFFNLLLNAKQSIKHNNGRIVISAERADEESINIRVRDNGTGIAADDLQRIFDAFYSTKQPSSGKGGIGVGLTLCRDIIEEHGGSITVESQPGTGTTFCIHLPSADPLVVEAATAG